LFIIINVWKILGFFGFFFGYFCFYFGSFDGFVLKFAFTIHFIIPSHTLQGTICVAFVWETIRRVSLRR
jgi:hypothetical protein